ncbi:DUF2125 domain-containing protein [Pseudooceanicola sediminis]|nr:DUF2125 domain-containing protein [Pseudooceanicola sediminis]
MRTPLVISGLFLAQAFATPAFSLTPEEVWTEWNTALDGSGIHVTADVERLDQQMNITHLTLRLPPDDEGGSAELSLGGITLAPVGDGTVRITLEPDTPFALTTPGPTLRGHYAQAGFVMTASGAPGDTDYAYRAQTLNLRIDEMSGPDGAVQQMQPPITLIADAPSGQASLGTRDRISLTQSSAIDSLRVSVQQTDPKVGDLSLNLMAKTLKSDTESWIDPARVAQDGLRAARHYSSAQSFGAADMQFSLVDGSDSLYLQSDSQGGQSTTTLDGTGLSYDMTASQTTLGVRGSDIPFALQTSIGQVRAAASGPTQPQDSPQPFSLTVALDQVTLPDIAWAILDATGKLPRDPISLTLEMTGEGRLLANDQPPEITSLNVENFDLRGLGAQISADGAFDADPAQRSRFGAYPKFTGQLNVRAKGVMSVIQTLTSTGILPPSVGFSSALYAGMFARQVNGPDDLATTLKVTPDEEIMINGQVISP